MTPNIGYLILGLLGGVLSCLIFCIILARKASKFEGNAKSAEAINNELRQQIEQKTRELGQTQEDLNNESQSKAALEAKYFEAEKSLRHDHNDSYP